MKYMTVLLSALIPLHMASCKQDTNTMAGAVRPLSQQPTVEPDDTSVDDTVEVAAPIPASAPVSAPQAASVAKVIAIEGDLITSMGLGMDDRNPGTKNRNYNNIYSCIRGEFCFSDVKQTLISTKDQKVTLTTKKRAGKCNHDMYVTITHLDGKVDVMGPYPSDPQSDHPYDLKMGEKLDHYWLAKATDSYSQNNGGGNIKHYWYDNNYTQHFVNECPGGF
ncbi:MAG: hypothetical protein H7249_12370 [Chitinophagaceae bacterium]|nr:hypothetical protein [Oligoflexus sp.]